MGVNNGTVGAYRLVTPFKNTNSGFAMWAFATNAGKQCFIKQFLSPVCPKENCGIPAETVRRRREQCQEYYRTKTRLYEAINRSSNGNIVKINDFFLYDTKYYIVTDKIDTATLPPEKIAALPEQTKMQLLKVLANNMVSLHRSGVVHADLKLTNVLIKRTSTGSFTAKLIDFDSSYFAGEQPKADDIQGDQIYFAPETCLAILGNAVALDHKVDVFSLGLLFHQYYTGRLPGTGSHAYAYEALLHDEKLRLDPSLPAPLSELIRSMLDPVPERRADTEEVFRSLQGTNKGEDEDELLGKKYDDRPAKSAEAIKPETGAASGSKGFKPPDPNNPW